MCDQMYQTKQKKMSLTGFMLNLIIGMLLSLTHFQRCSCYLKVEFLYTKYFFCPPLVCFNFLLLCVYI